MELSSSGESGPSPEGQDELHVVVRATLGSATAAVQAPAIDEARERLSARVAREGRLGGVSRAGLSGLLHIPRGGRSRHEGFLGTRTLRRWVWPLGAVATLGVMFSMFRAGSSQAAGITRSYATGAYQQGILTLDDGTRVTLAPETRLRLANFGMQHRTVDVDGKAYFEVANAKGVPFEVRTGTVTTQVLGTSFLVNHARQSSHVRVAVEEGKVRIWSASRAEAAFTVTAGHVGDITDSSVAVNAVVDTGSGAEWLQGQLFFHETPVATVLQTLSRWYGYRFRYADSSLSQRQVTISLSVHSPESALATLEQILRVSLTMHGDTVTLTPQAVRPGTGLPKVRTYDVWTPTREVGR